MPRLPAPSPHDPTDFRPGEGGFGVHVSCTEVPLITLAGLAWAALMIAGAIAVLLLFMRLTHHEVRTPALRPAVSWVPAPRSTERALVSREVGSVP